MKKFQILLLHSIFWIGLISLSSCQPAEKKSTIAVSRTEMTAEWDNAPNDKATAVFAPYKAKVDSIMDPIVGKSAIDMSAGRPEGLLSNLIADVLRNSTVPYSGQPADIGIINVGGIRNSLGVGDISYRTIYEILPFENSLCILSLMGKDVKDLIQSIMKSGGEGLSNIQVVVNKDMDVMDLKIGKKPVKDNQLYSIATVDYLAEGNERMQAFQRAEKRTCIKEATIREIFLEYIKSETAKGKRITSQLDGRVTIKEN